MKTIPLTKGYEAIVDDADYDFLMQWKWHALVSGRGVYAERCERPKGQKVSHIMMHRVINKTPDGMDTDHDNGNTLDNRRHNLRSATRAQNMWNRKPNSKGASKYKGVAWHKQHRKWIVAIQHNKKRLFVGLFTNEQEAATAYANKAAELRGEFHREIIYV